MMEGADNTTVYGVEGAEEEWRACKHIDDLDKSIINLFTLPCIIVSVILMFFKRRKQLCMKCLKGRPGVLSPVNFIDEYERSWAFAAVFALMSYRALLLFDGEYFWIPEIYNDVAWASKWGWTKVFISMLNILQMCAVFHPLFACIVLRKHIVANILGLLLVIPWAWVSVEVYLICPIFGAYDEGERLESIFKLIFDIPVFVSYLLLEVCYVWDLTINVCNIYRQRHTQHKTIKDEVDSHHIQYVKALMKRKTAMPATTLKEHIKAKFTCTRIIGFKFPPRIICTMVVCALVLYKLGTSLNVVHYALGLILLELEKHKMAFIMANTTGIYDSLVEVVPIAQWCFTTSNMLSFVLHVIFMIHMVICYRSHMWKMIQGNHNWHFKYTADAANHLISGMRYSGYQIAYFIYGFLIMVMMLFIIIFILTYFIIVPLTKGETNFLLAKIKSLWPTVAIGIVINYLQILLAKYAFLQEQGQHVALNNRRVYHLMSFFLFFFNILLGLFSCLKRIIFSLVFGVLLISRLDRCLLMRGFEGLDAGHRAYLGMLTVDLYHNHPVLKAFVQVLQNEAEKARQVAAQASSIDMEEGERLTISDEQIIKTRIRNRWLKLLTLTNNPELVTERLHQNVRNLKKQKSQNVDENKKLKTVIDEFGATSVHLDVYGEAGRKEGSCDTKV